MHLDRIMEEVETTSELWNRILSIGGGKIKTMKKFIYIVLMALIPFMAFSQNKVLLTVGGNTMTATLADNEATRELKTLLEKGSLTIEMSDYGGFEKVGVFPQSFTTSDSRITTEPGDIMLYQGDNMVIFYGSNSWSYTQLGKIDGATESNMKQFLGVGSISLTLSLEPAASMEGISFDRNTEDIIYDLNGNRITGMSLSPGIYIINGKKKSVPE